MGLGQISRISRELQLAGIWPVRLARVLNGHWQRLQLYGLYGLYAMVNVSQELDPRREGEKGAPRGISEDYSAS